MMQGYSGKWLKESERKERSTQKNSHIATEHECERLEGLGARQ